MADNNIDILVDLKVEENRVIRALDNAKSIMNNADRRTTKYKKSVEAVVQAELKLAQIRKQRIALNKQAENSVKNLTKAQIQAKNATGATTSAALELGRVISDAPYGIRGMANNLTQLVSQMAFATKSAGGFRLALRGLWTAMMGPLGIVLAITTVISAFDWFYGANEKAEKSTDDFSSSLEELANILSKDVNVSIEEYIKLVRQKTELDKNTAKLANDLKLKEDALNKVVEYRLELEERMRNSKLDSAILQETINELADKEKKINEEIAEIYKNATDEINKYKEAKKGLSDDSEEAIKGSLKDLKQQLAAQKKHREEVATTASEYKAVSIVIDDIKKKIEAIEGKEDKKDPKERVEALFNFPTDKEIKKEAELKLKVLAEALEKTNEGFEFNSAKTKDDLFSVLNIDPNSLKDLSEETKAAIRETNEAILKELVRDMEYQDFSEYAEITQKGLTSINDFLDAQFDRRLTMEENHTNKLNEELNNRLLNEQLSADERANIQNQIAQNDEALRKKQNEIKKKQFNSQKAFNIANALIDTSRAAAGVMADADGGFFARLSQAIPTIAFGLAQVATIASQKFQPDAASTPIRTSSSTGGSSGVGNRTFDFNLVGNNQQNQLAEAIGGQFSQPLKAYVVSKDITNQQQLDVNTKATARFGG